MLTCYIQGSSLCPRITISPKRSSLIQFSGEVKKWLDWECMCYVLCAKLLQSCPTLCSPMDCSPPGSSVHAILQARILEWVAIPLSSRSSQARDRTCVSCIAGGFFTVWATREVEHSITKLSKIELKVSRICHPKICLYGIKITLSWLFWEIVGKGEGFPGRLVIKNLPAMKQTQVRSLGWEDPLEEGMVTHSNTLA